MGNTTSALLEAIKLKAIVEASDEPGSRTSFHDAFRWDPKDCSPRLQITGQDQQVVRDSTHAGFDLVRTRGAFCGGVHVWEIHWSAGHYGRHARVGVCQGTSLPTHTTDPSRCLGMDSSSFAWDLSSGKLLHNGTTVDNYPKSHDETIPHVIVVAVHLDRRPATLGFYTEDLKLMVEIGGLEVNTGCFYPAISVSQPRAMVQINYLGGSESILGFSRSILTLLTFSELHGSAVYLSEDQRIAGRLDFTGTHTVLCSSRCLATNELFEVEVKECDDQGSGSFAIGVWSNSPTMTCDLVNIEACTKGDVWLYHGYSITQVTDGKRRVLQEINNDLNNLKVGDTVGVRVTEDSQLMLYVNGTCLTHLKMTPQPHSLHAVIQMSGSVSNLLIKDPDYLSVTKSDIGVDVSDASVVLHNAMQAIELMREKNTATIKKVHDAVQTSLVHVFLDLHSTRQISLLAGILAEIGAADVIVGYLKFLESCDMSSSVVWACYEMIGLVCQNYSHCSLLLQRAFAKADLLRLCVQTIEYISSTYKQVKTKEKKLKLSLAILLNCAQLPENLGYYHRYEVFRRAGRYTDIEEHPIEIAMESVFLMSLVADDDEATSMEVSETLMVFILSTLYKAIHSPTKRCEGFFMSALVDVLTRLARNRTNCELVVNNGGIDHLVEVLRVGDKTQCECALNAIYEHITPSTVKKVAATRDLDTRLDELRHSADEWLCQAADRCLQRLRHGGPLSVSDEDELRRSCTSFKVCLAFRKKLGIRSSLFNPRHDMCYCAECHSKRGDKPHYIRGRPPKQYSIPVGWARFALNVPSSTRSREAFKKWHRAYYGTNASNVVSIIENGAIACTENKSDKKILVHSGPVRDDLMKDVCLSQTLLSPSVRYAGCDAFAKSSRFKDEDSDQEFNARVVLQVFVKPGSYNVGPQTLGIRRQLDPSFSNQELVWASQDPDSVILYGLLVKLEELGVFRQYLSD